MAFGFSVGDIIAASKLAKAIYENCFTREQAAGESLVRLPYLTAQSIQARLGIPQGGFGRLALSRDPWRLIGCSLLTSLLYRREICTISARYQIPR